MGKFEMVKDFFFGISRSRVSLLGAMVVTVTTPFLFGYMLADTVWHIQNPYFGAFVYLALGPLFLGGLGMIFFGAFFLRGERDVHLFTFPYLRRYFTEPEMFGRLRRNVFLIVLLTSVNFCVFSMFLYRAYHYMESTQFCGQFCHTVMNPEYTAYQNSPHSRVTCVECHIGAGAGWFVKSKISGARQLLAVAAGTYPTPIETPVHGLRPARETCEECHRPALFHGDKLSVKQRFMEDEANSAVQDVLLLKIGSAGDRTDSSHGIHWHVAPENQVSYTSTDHSRMIIPEVTLTKADGTTVVFRTDDADELLKENGNHSESRAMDCIDCHNRPSHVYLGADEAINRKMAEGVIPASIPYIKRQALEVVAMEFQTTDAAQAVIAAELLGWYQKNYPDVVANQRKELDKAIAGVVEAYSENVFPEMKIGWGTYVNHITHGPDFEIGCFRCHDDMHESEDGQTISGDCNTCHTLLALEEANPEILSTLRGE
ncbi:MAG: NapC/NirT family cytochrome c [Desulfuromonadales bacterium]|nr:NapC/NirT family cytochrome c [Desulfuromonadales bacterium]